MGARDPMTRRARPARLALCGLVLVACGGPYRLLVAHSPDRRHALDIVELDGHAALGIDGRRADEFEGILASTLTFDPSGRHIAYAVKQADHYRLALDHCPGPAFDGLGAIVFSLDGGRLAYAASIDDRWVVVVDGSPGPLLNAVFAGTLGFDAAGVHLLYAAQVEGGARVFVDHAPGPLMDAVGQLRLTRDGRAAYVARRGPDTFVVHGRELSLAAGPIGALWIGEQGLTAYTVRRARDWVMSWNGRLVSAALDAPDIAGSDDGRHAAWLVRSAAGSTVWLDGAPLAGPFPSVRSRTLTFAAGQATPSWIAEASDGRPRAIIAGVEQPALDQMGALVFSHDGRHFAYAGLRAAQHVLIHDGVERVLSGPIADPVLSPAGDRVAYAPLQGPARVVVDDREHPLPLVLPDTLAFARDGRHWAVLAGQRAERRLYFAVDGKPGPTLDFHELISSIAADAADAADAKAKGTPARATLLHDWARATADALSPGPPDPAWLSGKCERVELPHAGPSAARIRQNPVQPPRRLREARTERAIRP
jgi:hypothetical protein